jgi:hypothetical protein
MAVQYLFFPKKITMKKSYLILPLLCLSMAACERSDKNKPLQNSSGCEKNGAAVAMQFNRVALQLPDSLLRFWFTFPKESTVYMEDLHFVCSAKEGKQPVLTDAYKLSQPDIASASFSVSDDGLTAAEYKLVTADTPNNYILITHQEANFTKNIHAEFSATFYKVHGPDNYPDTLRIRKGKTDESGRDAEIWE